MTIIKSYLDGLLKKKKREDGRGLYDYRKIKIDVNPTARANGSARVKLGETEVLVGVKLDVGDPFPDSPNDGILITNAELTPLASPEFEPGPPRENAIELARVVDRGVRESEVVELDKLCLEPGEKVWIVFIDIHILDYDGNLFDAASLASLAALSTTIVPAARFEVGEDYPLPLQEPPISCTSVKFNNFVIIDPSLDEEEIADARLTVATDKNDDIRAMQKGLNGSFTKEEIQKVIKASLDNGREIRKQLSESTGK